MKKISATLCKLLPGFVALALGANTAHATVSYLGSGALSGPDLSGLTGTLEDGTAENQLGTGSAIAYAGYGNRFFVVPDRGPNASTYNPAVDNTTSYISRTDEVDLDIVYNGVNWVITPSLVKTTLFKNATALTGATTASNPANLYFTGLSTGFDATNSSDSMRFDPEGIRISKNGNSVFVSDEYGPFVYEFNRFTGQRIRSLNMPAKYAIASPSSLGSTEISGNLAGRQGNRGMEGLAISPDGTKLYGIMQNALLQDNALDGLLARNSVYTRILEIDVNTGVTREFVYTLATKSLGISEILAINDHELLVLERDSKVGVAAVVKKIYKIDIAGATDVSATVGLPASGVIPGVTPVTKVLFLDMLNASYGLAGANFPEKIEGMAFGPDLADGRHTLVITNDNDFDVAKPNNFYVFAIGAADLNYAPQNVAVTGPDSSQSPYLVKSQNNVVLQSILTVGDSVNNKPDGITPYRMVGIPDGLGAFDNGDNTFTVLMNHELGNTQGIARAHGAMGSFVSKWIVNKNDLSVVSGADLIQDVKLWNGAAYASQVVAINRMCAADLPALSAFYDMNSSTGYNGRIFMNGEEAGAEGRAFAHLMDGTSYELPRLGKFSYENTVAHPDTGLNTVVVGLDDSGNGQVYVYVGSKTNAGLPVDRAGLTNGNLYGVKITGLDIETDLTTEGSVTAFTLYSLGDVSALTGAQLETNSGTNVSKFQRPEDGVWDKNNANDFYFLTTASFTGKSRLWRLRFTDAANPALGGTATMLLEGAEGQKMMDNMTINNFGQILIQEDPGGQAHTAKIWSYDIQTDALTQIAEHDPARFVIGGANYLNTQDEESSGIIDVSAILGTGWYLLDVQAHYNIAGELVQGGQLLAMHIDYADTDGDALPDTVDNCPANSNVNQLNTDNDGQGNVCDADDDNDSALDVADAFPLDAAESVDTDSDGTGNNADTDDDNDGYLDVDEVAAGTDPLDAASHPLPIAVVGDTDGDGYGDVVTWNTTTGNGYQYLMSSNNLRAAAPNAGVAFAGFLPSAYTQLALTDFNRDGSQDTLLRNNSDGTWAMLEYSIGSPGAIAMNVPMSVNPADMFVAAADIDGDGYKDVLLRNSSTGVWTVYFLQNDIVLSSSAIAASLLPDWQMAAVADFNGDGRADLLLRSTSTKAWYLYELDGTSVLRSGSVAMAGAGWNFAGTGDFNADGIQDVLLRRASDGAWYEYTFNDYANAGITRFKSYGAMGLTPIGAAGLAWSVLALADVDGSGSTDLLLYRASDRAYYLYGLGGVTGRTIVGATVLPVSTSAAWAYQTMADYNGDGKLDILMRNTTTGVSHMYGFGSYNAGAVFSYQGYASAITTDLNAQIIK